MSAPGLALAAKPYGTSAAPEELFPESIQNALVRIEALCNTARPNEARPSHDNVTWAKKVLLRIVPRYYLLGAEIDSFQREIHINWERGNKSVTVFLPAPDEVKIYQEEVTLDGIKHSLVPQANDPWEVNNVLRWLFA
jgi:hypothetical protein